MRPSLLEQIREGIYFGTILENDVLEVIELAKNDIQKDIKNKCEHSYIFVTEGYGYEKCSKCGVLKQ